MNRTKQTLRWGLMRYALIILALWSTMIVNSAEAQMPAALLIPTPSIQTDAPYKPQALLPGGIVVPLYPPDSPIGYQNNLATHKHLPHQCEAL